MCSTRGRGSPFDLTKAGPIVYMGYLTALIGLSLAAMPVPLPNSIAAKASRTLLPAFDGYSSCSIDHTVGSCANTASLCQSVLPEEACDFTGAEMTHAEMTHAEMSHAVVQKPEAWCTRPGAGHNAGRGRRCCRCSTVRARRLLHLSHPSCLVHVCGQGKGSSCRHLPSPVGYVLIFALLPSSLPCGLCTDLALRLVAIPFPLWVM